jgi:hypothetical protein
VYRVLIGSMAVNGEGYQRREDGGPDCDASGRTRRQRGRHCTKDGEGYNDKGGMTPAA